MKRRNFLGQFGLIGTGLLSPTFLQATYPSQKNTEAAGELSSEVIIIGGGLGGVAAALAVCRNGSSAIMTEPTDWIGGQVSQQAVPPDEHTWIETHGRTKSYATFRTLVRNYYREHYALTPEAHNKKYLNPGNGSVSRLCHEPAVAAAVLQSMLAPAINAGKLHILLNTQPVEASTNADRISSVRCKNHITGKDIILHGKQFIDASEEGDLLPLTGTEYVIGAESQKQTGEPHAPEKPNPSNIQALTWCFAMDHLEGENHIIERPSMYEFWKNHTPALKPPWSGPLLSLNYSSPRDLKPKELAFIPCGKTEPAPKTKSLNLWLYRRIIDRNNFIRKTYSSDITIVNWPQNDYMLGNITDVTEKVRNQNLFKAKQLSLSLLYWLQTEAPRPDGKQGWKGLRLRKDITGMDDGLAKYPYIRESRRIKAEYTIREQDISKEERQKVANDKSQQLLAKPFYDSVGIGYYHLDLHPSTGGDNYIDTGSTPFQIPLGAMIPIRMENLVPGCKNIGTTHISNGSYRLHPVEWSIGEAAGTLCAFALTKNLSPRVIRNTPRHLKDYQSLLTKNGIELKWNL